MKNKYFQLVQEENTADLYIFGDIVEEEFYDNEVSPTTLMAQLNDLECDNLNIYINSYGGSVSAGLSIYNQLKQHKAKVTTYCQGFACSIASIIFMAGDERIMNTGSLLMVHNPWTVVAGNSIELRKQADALDKIAQASINIYMQHINITEDKLVELLDNETWLTPQEAVEYGFATSIVEDNNEAVCQSVKQSLMDIIVKSKEVSKEEEVIEDTVEVSEEPIDETSEEDVEEIVEDTIEVSEESIEDIKEDIQQNKKFKPVVCLNSFLNII